MGESMWEMTVFGESPLTSFKLDVLREYLRHRCDGKDSQDAEAMDVDADTVVEEEEEQSQQIEKEEEEDEPLLPPFTYSLNENIWDKLSSVRSYPSLPIEDKLQILRILMRDAMTTTVMAQWTRQRIEQYQSVKQQIKEMDDEYTNMVKEEKSILRTFRTQWLEKRKKVYPKKDSKRSKSITAADAGSVNETATPGSNAVSETSSISPSHSPNRENKENNASRANSRSRSKEAVQAQPLGEAPRRRSSSRREELQRKKREKEMERLRKQREIEEERARKDSMDARTTA